MPYIKEENRQWVTSAFQIKSSGELNYYLTKQLNNYITTHLERGGQLSYDFMNSIVGVLQCIQDEFKRRFLWPYEDKKIQENGDVYTFHIEEVKK